MPTPANPPPQRILVRAAGLYFLLVFGAGVILGSVRVPFLVPRIGERLAELAEMPVMFVVIYFAARYVSRRFLLPEQLPVRLKVGILALLMAVCAELLFAAVLAGRSVGAYIASRDPVSGSVYLTMLILFAAMPSFQARRGIQASSKRSSQT